MQGKLHYIDQGWTVTYITSDPLPDGRRWVRIAELPLHEQDVSRASQVHIVDDDKYICNGENVEFEIVEDFAKLVQ